MKNHSSLPPYELCQPQTECLPPIPPAGGGDAASRFVSEGARFLRTGFFIEAVGIRHVAVG